ncbi:MAG: hypothetical protein K6D97_04215 [Clostridia bacterium]|nr:hypothetical protein [Clostridia bacterium]
MVAIEDNTVSAEELRVVNTMRQRRFINKKLQALRDNPPEDGNTDVIYHGCMLVDNYEYFKSKGYLVTPLDVEDENHEALWRISVDDKECLTDAQLAASAEFAKGPTKKNVD